jgi:hypothetical protein
VKWSIEHARRENYSLILEGVFRDPQMPLATAEAFADTHTVEVVSLAVREEVSRLDGEYRFLQGGRWTPPELHDLSYLMMPETIRLLASSQAVQRVTITDRSGADLYVLDKTSGTTADPAAAATALVDLRTRPLKPEEARSWVNRQRDTVITYAMRGAVDDTSRPNLVRITHQDADLILPMADPDPEGQLRESYEAAQPLLRLLVTDSLRPMLPIRLQTDTELSAQSSTPGQLRQEQAAAELARRVALTPAQRHAEDLVRLQLHLTDQAVPIEPIDVTGEVDVSDAVDPDAQAALGNLAAQTLRSALTKQPVAAGEPANPAEHGKEHAAGPAAQPAPADPDNSTGLD